MKQPKSNAKNGRKYYHARTDPGDAAPLASLPRLREFLSESFSGKDEALAMAYL